MHYIRFSALIDVTLAAFDEAAYKVALARALDVAASRVSLAVIQVDGRRKRTLLSLASLRTPSSAVRIRSLQSTSLLNVTATVHAANATAAAQWLDVLVPLTASLLALS